MEAKYSETDLKRAENEIRRYIRDSALPSSPVELFEKLRQAHISEYMMRLALWTLIDRNEIVITSDRKIDVRTEDRFIYQSGAASIG